MWNRMLNRRRDLPVVGLIFFLFVWLILIGVQSENSNNEICDDVDLSEVTLGKSENLDYDSDLLFSIYLAKLRNCRVIEGSVELMLFDYNNSTLEGLTFPNLFEITEYLLVYRVQGLKSLSHMFPNLQVIRGNALVGNSALIIYDMVDLTEIGLKSLTKITHGSVSIQNNPLLCFVDTINWEHIATGYKIEDNSIASNKPTHECPICSSGKQDNKADGSAGSNCSISLKRTKRYCWSQQHFQKICPSTCGERSCDENGNCCEDTCLGACDSKNSSICSVCKLVGPNLQCVEKCPDDFHIEKYYPHLCKKKPCDWSPNPKVYCTGGTIDSLSTAKGFHKCRIIFWPLTIRIRLCEQNFIKELEESLQNIEEIQGGLTITGSYPLVSLNFFKNLKIVTGVENGYALRVTNNQNLESLFDHNVTFEHGKVFVHNNPKLCYSSIESLKYNIVDLRDIDQFEIQDVALDSNGDKVSCNMTSLSAKASIDEYSNFLIGQIFTVEGIKYDKEQSLVDYEIYFKPAPFQNVSIYDSRDACGQDGWSIKSIEMDSIDVEQRTLVHRLENLKPFTQYAYYIKTYTISSKVIGSQTDIQYFTSPSSQPEPVQKVKLIAIGSSSINVTWEPPKEVNGKLTNYIIQATLIDEDADQFKQRNDCDARLDEPLEELEYNVTEMSKEFKYIIKRVMYMERLESTESQMVNGYYVRFYDNNTNSATHSFVLSNLRPFSIYSVLVQACRDFDSLDFDANTYCSSMAPLHLRTLKDENSDSIEYLHYNKVRQANSVSSKMKLFRSEPENQNVNLASDALNDRRVDSLAANINVHRPSILQASLFACFLHFRFSF